MSTIGNRIIDELTPLTFTAVAEDENPIDTLTFSLGMDAIAYGMTIDASTGEFSWTPSESQGPGAFSATIIVKDNGTPPLQDSETISVSVYEVNVAPTVDVTNDTVSVDEGRVATNTGTFSDSDNNDSVKITASVGTVVVDDALGTWFWEFATEDGPAQSQTVTIVAKDRLEVESKTTFDLNVRNAPPVIDHIAVPESPVRVDSPVDVEVRFSDAGGIDSHQVTWDWGDGNTSSLSSATSPASKSHTYAQPGVYAVEVTVSDNSGDIASQTQNIVVHDLNDGLVIGPDLAVRGEPLTFRVNASDLDAASLGWEVRNSADDVVAVGSASSSRDPCDGGSLSAIEAFESIAQPGKFTTKNRSPSRHSNPKWPRAK